METNLDNYRKDGYLILKNFFRADQIQSILLDAQKIFYRQFLKKKYTTLPFDSLDAVNFNECLFRLFSEDLTCLMNCGKQAQHLISLHRLSLDEKIVGLLNGLGLSSPNISTRPVLYFNHPLLAQKKVFHKVDAHQDWRSMQGSLNSAVIWIPLMDVNKELGALEIIPGSHLWGLRTNNLDSGFGMVQLTEKETGEFISVELSQGDILAFSSFLIHQSGENTTASPRWSTHFRYNDLDEQTFIDRAFAHPYIYKPAEELITPGFPKQDQVKKIFHQ